jgi:cytochrome c-type biogenesis protein
VLLSLSFFLGVVLSLLALGVAASFAGRLFSRWKAAFAIGAALFSLAAGLAAIFGPTVRRYVPDPEVNKRGGIAGAFLYGLLYSVATVTTSAGPLLLLLTIAAAIGRPVYGAALSLSYAIGRGLPFLLLGLFAGTVGAWLARLGRARRIVEVVSGVALVTLAFYFGWLARAL